MKYIKYVFSCDGVTFEKTATWSEEAEEVAKTEAVNGEYTIEDDGMPEEPPVQDDMAERIAALEEQLAAAKILLGVD